jgi:tungstate transport system substrate-binding protein
LACAASLLAAASPRLAAAEDKFIIVQSTTSTQNSGLFEHILPIFTKKTGIEVRVVAVGTGQALKNAENGDGDVVFVHSKPDEGEVRRRRLGREALRRHVQRLHYCRPRRRSCQGLGC